MFRFSPKVAGIFCFLLTMNCGAKKSDPKPASGNLQLFQVRAGTQILSFSTSSTNVPIESLIVGDFSAPLDTTSVSAAVQLLKSNATVPAKISYLNNFQSISLKPTRLLTNNQEYQFSIATSLKGKAGETFKGTSVTFTTIPAQLSLQTFKVNGSDALSQNQLTDVSLNATIEFDFSSPINPQSVNANNFYFEGKTSIPFSLAMSNQNKTVTLTATSKLRSLDRILVGVTNGLQGANSEIFSGFSKTFYTKADTIPVFPVISDSALLDLVQKQTLKYFYDLGHPISGMALERNSSGDIVTTGGSGFGLMAMITGVNRGFISRSNGIARFNKIISFLETADRFHGAWPHWLNGSTGKVVPFSANDNGADLVETAYMVQGLIALRQYLTPTDTAGNNLINRINKLWNTVEWDWFRQSDQSVLFWHWSPDKGWIMNLPIRGYNETLIVYLLAAASTTHTIPTNVYQQGWAQSGSIKNGKTFYGHVLPLGEDYGGPLFFTQYSFLGFSPHVQDSYLSVDYWTQNVNQSLINHDYCVANPKKFVGYNDSGWGLTASDIPSGYGAQSPTNDNGTVSPTAAISSMPYTPTESMKAIKFFYYTLGDRLWGPYGFYDAVNITNGWAATSTLAIDQGPIVVMVENYRTQLLWKLFMSAPEVQAAKTKLGFN